MSAFVLLALEAISLVAFAVLGRSMGDAALAVMVIPFVAVLLLAVSTADRLLLLLFAGVLPLSALELVPQWPLRLVVYIGVLGLLVFFRATRAAVGEPPSCGRMEWFESAPLAVLVLWIVISALNAYLRGWWSPFIAYYSTFALLVFVLVWLSATVPSSLDDVRRVLFMMCASYLVVPLVLPFFVTGVPTNTLGKTLTTPYSIVSLNVLGSHMATFAAVALGLNSRRQSALRRLALALLVISLVAVLVFTKSRGAWLGFGAAVVFLAWRKRSVWMMVLIALAVVALLSVNLLRVSVLSRLEATSAQDPSLWGRILLWKYALDIFRTNWLLGVGWENFRYVKHLFGYPLHSSFGTGFDTNSLYFEFLVDLGLVGFGAFVWLLFGTLARLVRSSSRTDVQNGDVPTALAAGIVAFGVHGMLDCVIWQHGAFMLLGLLLGLAIATRRLLLRVPSGVAQRKDA